MPESNYVAALEEIYRLTLRSEGKRERRTRQICRDLLGVLRCKLIEATDEISRRSSRTIRVRDFNSPTGGRVGKGHTETPEATVATSMHGGAPR